MPYDAVAEAIALSGQMGEDRACRHRRRRRRTVEARPGRATSAVGSSRSRADPTERGVVYAAAAHRRHLEEHRTPARRSTRSGPTANVQSMGAVFVDQDGVVWAGTGEPDMGGGSAYYGDGVYRSDDGGGTWQNMGLAKSGSVGAISDRPDRRRPRVRRGPGPSARHRRPARPVPERGRRRDLGPRARGRRRPSGVDRRDRRRDQPEQPRLRAGHPLGQDPRPGRPHLRQGLEALPLDRRRAHLDRRAAGTAPDQLRLRGSSRSPRPTSVAWASSSHRASPGGST